MACSPQTASMKSRTIPSKSVEFQLVAGLVAVQSGGVSSGTTTFGYVVLALQLQQGCLHREVLQLAAPHLRVGEPGRVADVLGPEVRERGEVPVEGPALA